MKRFILCSLSATMAVALGSVARAAETHGISNAQLDENLLSEYVGDGYSQAEERRFEYRGQDLTGGIISPNDQGPNNRAVPTTGGSGYSEDMMYRGDDYSTSDTTMDGNDYPTEGTILSPDSQGPNNRAEPGSGPVGEDNYAPSDTVTEEGDYPTEGTILSPDSQGPNNRAVPGSGQVDEEY